MRTRILPYRMVESIGKNCSYTDVFAVMKNNFFIAFISFLVAKVSIGGGLMPFGMAMYALSYCVNVNRYLVAGAVILGSLFGGVGNVIGIFFSMVIFELLNKFIQRINLKEIFKIAFFAFISTLISGFVFAYFEGLLVFDLLKSVLGSIVVFGVIYVLGYAKDILGGSRKKYILSSEEIISFGVLMGLCLAGFGDFGLFGIIIKNVFSVFLILLYSSKCGPGVGTAVGVAMGAILSMGSGNNPALIGTYAFCGLVSGMLRNFERVGAVLGFLSADMFLTVYLNNSSEPLITVKEIIFAAVLFMIFPKRNIESVMNRFCVKSDWNPDKRSLGDRIREITVERLNRLSTAFSELSKMFGEISETKVITDKQDISALFDRVADKICKDCGLCLHCWDKNFYNTYQVMFKIVEKLDKKGYVESHDIPEYFYNRCQRLEDFVHAVNNIYEVFKVNVLWKSKIGESRGVVSRQLEGLAKVISDFAGEFNMDMNFNQGMESVILEELWKKGIDAAEVIAFENKWGKYEISLFLREQDDMSTFYGDVDRLISDVAGRTMFREVKKPDKQYNNDTFVLKYLEKEQFEVSVGVARLAKNKNKISGDTYTFLNTGEGKYIMVLSDGMGSGQMAATQSKTAVNMFERFIEAGFDKDISIKMINSVLVLKSTDDSFATIDLSFVDLYNGDVEFVKVGAAPTFIKKGSKVETVKVVSLPAGILGNIETELIHKNVANGDFVIMMTDGVTDSFSHEDEKIVDFIGGIETKNPQEMANLILDQAYRNYGGNPLDDMLVMVGKVWDRKFE